MVIQAYSYNTCSIEIHSSVLTVHKFTYWNTNMNLWLLTSSSFNNCFLGLGFSFALFKLANLPFAYSGMLLDLTTCWHNICNAYEICRAATQSFKVSGLLLSYIPIASLRPPKTARVGNRLLGCLSSTIACITITEETLTEFLTYKYRREIAQVFSSFPTNCATLGNFQNSKCLWFEKSKRKERRRRSKMATFLERKELKIKLEMFLQNFSCFVFES